MNKLFKRLKKIVHKNFIFSAQQKSKIKNNIKEIVESDCNQSINTIEIDALAKHEMATKLNSKEMGFNQLSND